MAHDVFISYGREDSNVMQRVDQSLRAAGLTTWTDHGIHPGSPSWKVEIETAIRDASCIVVLFSPDSAESRWVRAELDYADAQRKPIYPLLVRGDTTNAIPFGFTSYQWIDVREASQLDAGLARLIAVLKDDQANLSVSDLPVEKAIQVRPRLMIPIAIGMILAGLVLGTVLLISIPQTTAVSTPMSSENADATFSQPTALPTMPPFSVPDGFKKLEGKQTLLAVPSNWATDFEPDILADSLKTIAGNNQGAKDVAQMVLDNLDVIAIEMVHFQSASTTVENVGVNLAYNVIEERQRSIYETAFPNGHFASHGTVDTPVGSMLVTEAYDSSIYLLSYALVREAKIYSVIFNGRFADKDTVNSNAQKIVQTFRVKE